MFASSVSTEVLRDWLLKSEELASEADLEPESPQDSMDMDGPHDSMDMDGPHDSMDMDGPQKFIIAGGTNE